jgi:hypothetical protein
VFIFSLITEHLFTLITFKFSTVEFVHGKPSHFSRKIFVVARRAQFSLLKPLIHTFFASDSLAYRALLKRSIYHISADRAFKGLIKRLD